MSCCKPSHTVPKFPLTLNYWRSSNPVTNPPSGTFKCQLVVSPHFSLVAGPVLGGSPTPAVFLYLPAKTDVRGNNVHPTPDVVEAPAGTGRFYQILWVDDIAKGFPNEFRLAYMQQFLPTGVFTAWPYPTP